MILDILFQAAKDLLGPVQRLQKSLGILKTSNEITAHIKELEAQKAAGTITSTEYISEVKKVTSVLSQLSAETLKDICLTAPLFGQQLAQNRKMNEEYRASKLEREGAKDSRQVHRKYGPRWGRVRLSLIRL